MKLVWCPETAAKAYIDAVKSLANRGLEDTNFAELVAAMAGGWKAQLVLQACATRDPSPATTVALAAAVKHTHGRRVIFVPDDRAASSVPDLRSEDVVLAGEAEEVMGEVEGVDFMVVDLERRDALRVIRGARAGARGMVVVCKNVERRKAGGGGGAGVVVGEGMRVVRSAFLPIGRGVEILHIGVGKGPRIGGGGGGCSRWFKHVDRMTGEEHLFRK